LLAGSGKSERSSQLTNRRSFNLTLASLAAPNDPQTREKMPLIVFTALSIGMHFAQDRKQSIYKDSRKEESMNDVMAFSAVASIFGALLFMTYVWRN
jgi:hypothetical protein